MNANRWLIAPLVAGLTVLPAAGRGGSYSAPRRNGPAAASSTADTGDAPGTVEIIEWGQLSRTGGRSAARRPRRRPEKETPTSGKLAASPSPGRPRGSTPTPTTTPGLSLLPNLSSATPPGQVFPLESPPDPEPDQAPAISPDAGAPPPAGAARFGRIPAHFIRNDGQIDSEVRFYLKGSRGTVYLTGREVVFDFLSRMADGGEDQPEPGAEEPSPTRLVFRMRFLGPSVQTTVEGNSELPGKVNYFVGARENWRSGIPTFGEVVYRNLYSGIDLACLFREGSLVYRWTIAPGADPHMIAWEYLGVDGLEIDPAGNLIVLTGFGGFPTPAPRLYQEVEGKRLEREGAFVIREGNTVGLEIGPYEETAPLVIEF